MGLIQSSYHPPSWRRYLLRGLFFLNFLALAADNWSTILFPNEQLAVLEGVAVSFWAGFSLLNLIGVRFPLKMLPILLLQFLYKSAWLIGVYLPAKKTGLMNESIEEFFWICVAGVVLNLFIVPWKYVYQTFFKNFFKR